MKPLFFSLFFFGNLFFLTASAQDYNDIGRTKKQEFSILKFNGYKLSRLPSSDKQVETYLAKRTNPHYANFDNIISFDLKTHLVVGVIWNFDHKNYTLIKSLLTDMNPTDSTYSELENKRGKAELLIDPKNQDHGLVIWKKKTGV